MNQHLSEILVTTHALIKEESDEDKIGALNAIMADVALCAVDLSRTKVYVAQLELELQKHQQADRQRKQQAAERLIAATVSGERNYLAEIEHLENKIKELTLTQPDK